MSFLDSLRKIFAGPTRIGDGSAEDAATLQEEFGATSAGEADLRHMEETGSTRARSSPRTCSKPPRRTSLRKSLRRIPIPR